MSGEVVWTFGVHNSRDAHQQTNGSVNQTHWPFVLQGLGLIGDGSLGQLTSTSSSPGEAD